MKYFSGQGAKKSVRNQLVLLCERSLVVAVVAEEAFRYGCCGSPVYFHFSYLLCLILCDCYSVCWDAVL